MALLQCHLLRELPENSMKHDTCVWTVQVVGCNSTPISRKKNVMLTRNLKSHCVVSYKIMNSLQEHSVVTLTTSLEFRKLKIEELLLLPLFF